MTTPQILHHSLLRPSVLHILRAAGYHSTKNAVLDTLTDLAARYMYALAQSTTIHAAINHTELDTSITDVRMALQDCGAFGPEKIMEDEDWEGEEDMRGVEEFLAWITGKVNKEIRRVASESGDGKEDYLAVLKKKHSTTDEDLRFTGTILGKAAEPRVVKVEGGDITSMKEWADRLKVSSLPSKTTSALSSRRQSSDLSSLEDMDDMDMSG